MIPVVIPVTASARKCPACRHKVDCKAATCPACGSDLPATEKGSQFMIALLAGLLFLGLGIVAAVSRGGASIALVVVGLLVFFGALALVLSRR